MTKLNFWISEYLRMVTKFETDKQSENFWRKEIIFCKNKINETLQGGY